MIVTAVHAARHASTTITTATIAVIVTRFACCSLEGIACLTSSALFSTISSAPFLSPLICFILSLFEFSLGYDKDMAIQITPQIEIEESEIQENFIRASGPGGQKVNKTSTAVQLRFDVANSPSLPNDVRQRLSKLAGNRMTSDGVLIIEANQYRNQERNRKDARRRLIQLIRRAAKRPRNRKKTAPTEAAKRRRLEEKRRRSEVKRLRRDIPPPE